MNINSYGLKVRSTGATSANLDSSTSHVILQIKFKTSFKKCTVKYLLLILREVKEF